MQFINTVTTIMITLLLISKPSSIITITVHNECHPMYFMEFIIQTNHWCMGRVGFGGTMC